MASSPSGNAAGGRGDATLSKLYAALRATDERPSDQFSETLVMGEGQVHAPLMLVGEQPGDAEDLAGRPFVGPAGHILDQCLAAAGIVRDRIFLTNAVKRFKFTPRGKRRIHVRPTAGEIDHYRWWLKEEIRLVAPAALVALGATAVRAMTGKSQPIAPLRGKTLATAEGQRLFVTVHPSFLLRTRGSEARDEQRDEFIHDLRQAAAAVDRALS
jgi:DNA polymerase